MTVADSDDCIKDYPCLYETVKGKDEMEMLKFRAKVKKYESYIRKYYLHNPVGTEEQFRVEVAEYSRRLLDEIPLTATKSQKSYWQARVLSKRPECLDQALFLAQKALRLNAYMIDSWIICSQILWDQQNLSSAINCIKDAYNTEVSPKTLAYMSFVLRMSALNCEDKAGKEGLLKDSINKAETAISQKPRYPFGLYCLGMSHFYSYFHSKKNNDEVLELSVKLLEEAAKEGFVRSDLYINLSEAAVYFQNYSKALEYLEKARQIEPFFCSDKLPQLLGYLDQLSSEVARQKNVLKNRRSLEDVVEGLGNYSEAVKRLSKTETFAWVAKDCPKRKLAEIRSLDPNKGDFVVHLRVLNPIITNFSVPKVFAVADEAGAVVVLSLYNVSESFRLMVNSVVTILNPLLLRVLTPTHDFECLRCTHPENFLRNGKPLEPSELQSVSIALTL